MNNCLRASSSQVTELELIRAIGKWAGNGLIGDDCAILKPKPGHHLLVTTDLLVEGTHFTHRTHTAYACGWKLLARGLSDIAAMGGEPQWCFVSLGLAPALGRPWLASFYRGLRSLARRHKVELAGGDLTRAALTAADITVIGAVPAGKALTRSGARAGDLLYVSGRLGAMAASGYTLAPHPRVDFGIALRKLGATACMDLSDGLSLDLHRLALASGLRAQIDTVPVAKAATIGHALHGGEDYELLFALPPGRTAPKGSFHIGELTPGRPGALYFGGKPLHPKAWDPFAPKP